MQRPIVTLGITAVVLFTVLCAGVGGLVYWAAHTTWLGEDTDSPTRAQIESVGRFKLPPSAANIHARLEGFQDHVIWVRFEMAPADEAAFWSSTACAAPGSYTPLTKSELPSHKIDRPWWRPESATTFEARQGQEAGRFAQFIVVDQSDVTRRIVYLTTFEM